MNQTFHIEAIGRQDAGPAPVVQRMTMRAAGLDPVRARAMRLLRQAQAPQWEHGCVEAVRILDGHGSELFRWTVWDDLSASSRRP